MPDVIVHAHMGAEVYEKCGLTVDRDIFAFGLLGPDPYLFYRCFIPPFVHRVNRYSSVMHRTRTGVFLTELARRSRRDPDVFAYLAGFLCHYALDATTHPYINRKAKNDIAVHIAIEHRLDQMDGGALRLPPFLPKRMEQTVGSAITKVYGWDDAWDKLREGRRWMTPFYHMVTHENDVMNRILYHSHTRAELLTYRTSKVDHIDLRGFAPLYRRAIERGVVYVQAAKDYINGNVDETQFREIIGNRSYFDGRPASWRK